MGQISYFDVFFAAVVLVSTACAFYKGMSREIIGIGFIVLGFVLAVFYYHVPAAKISDLGRPEAAANLIGFLGIFLSCVLIGAIAAFITDCLLKAVKLKWADRLLGAVFGFLRGWVFSVVIVLALTAFPTQNGFTAQSLLVPYLLGSAGLLIQLTPDDLKEKFEEGSRHLIRYWNRGQHPKATESRLAAEAKAELS